MEISCQPRVKNVLSGSEESARTKLKSAAVPRKHRMAGKSQLTIQ
ncbi:hypothetical protein CLOSTHATH_00270 [Hungatella hathewayi DSM 13479]|uniref:Uncharacterized protein n=1 Tax=Hungatella hathewayi DSM 13479 TaxID=566550 RepID=D3A9J9_9FIRM|nr:hypothetical protein CLOSTHATH_00270 [Hungatella hathewayi DSM 13479]